MKRVHRLLASLPITALGLSAAPCAFADGISYTVPYGGVDVIQDAVFAYSGVVVALKQDASWSGFVLQGFIGKGGYSYQTSGVSTGEVDGDATWLRGLVGYQTYSANLRFAGYVGVDWQNNDLSPKDPGNPVSGSATGVMVTGEMESRDAKQLYVNLIGQYSTANDWYWTRARGGYAFGGKLIVGPEGVFFGNVGFNAQRAGGFVTLPVKISGKPVGITFSGGYQWIGDGDQAGQMFGNVGGSTNSQYGSLNIYALF